jgi:hypothetical protein
MKERTKKERICRSEPLNQNSVKSSNKRFAAVPFKLIDNYTVLQQTSVIFIS